VVAGRAADCHVDLRAAVRAGINLGFQTERLFIL
jgi:hypothetical protein